MTRFPARLAAVIARRWRSVVPIALAASAATCTSDHLLVPIPPPTLAAISVPSGVQGASVNATLTGTGFVSGATAVIVNGSGVSAGTVSVTSPTSATVTLAIASDAVLGARAISAATFGGVSGTVSFTVVPPPPSLTSVSPATGVQGATVTVSLTGTNFVSGATVQLNGTGVTVQNVNVLTATAATADIVVDANAALGDRTLTITTAGGTSATQTFTIKPPLATVTSITPSSSFAGVAVSVTITGARFLPGATVAVGGTGVAVSNVVVASSTSITATFTIDASAPAGARTVTVTTAGGPSVSGLTFTVLPPPPVLSGLSLTTGAQTGSQVITITGANFQPGATVVNLSGTGVTPSGIIAITDNMFVLIFAVAGNAPLGARSVTVTTPSGTSGALTFTVIAPPAILQFDALATHLLATQPARLRWAVSNATTCTISSGVSNAGSCNDSAFVTPGTTKTYTLTASAAGASVSATFQLFANEPGRWVSSTSSGGAVGTHVHQYSLDAATGSLTAIGGGTVAAGNTTQGLAVDPAGRYLYAANAGASDNISMYTIDATTGALTSIGTIAAGNDPTEIVVDPTGRFAYALNETANSISRYTIGATGSLVANGSSAVGNGPRGITIDGTGRFLYVANSTDKTISEFAINPDGTLALLGTFAVAGGGTSRPFYLVSDPAGRFLYLTHDTQGGVSQFRIGSDGTLTLVSGPTVLSVPPGTVRPVAVDPTMRFAYIVDFNNSILHEFTIDASTGVLTRFTAPTLPHTLPTTQTIQQFAIDPQGKFAYATDNNNGNFIIFTIHATTGTLSPVVAPLGLIAGGTSPFGVVVSR